MGRFDLGFSNIELWRSEEMQLVQLMIPAESAHDTIAALGDVGLLQFKDLNADKSAFQRTYANQVCRHDARCPAAPTWLATPSRQLCMYLLRSLCCLFRALSPQVKRCDEMARKIRFFHDQASHTSHAAVAAPVVPRKPRTHTIFRRPALALLLLHRGRSARHGACSSASLSVSVSVTAPQSSLSQQ
jgi:hypothetical protein